MVYFMFRKIALFSITAVFSVYFPHEMKTIFIFFSGKPKTAESFSFSKSGMDEIDKNRNGASLGAYGCLFILRV